MKYRIVVTRHEIVEVNAGSEDEALETTRKILIQKDPRDVFTLDVVTEIDA